METINDNRELSPEISKNSKITNNLNKTKITFMPKKFSKKFIKTMIVLSSILVAILILDILVSMFAL